MRNGNRLKRYLPILIGVVAAFISLAWFFTAPNRGVKEVPKILGHREGCLICHMPMNGFEKAHDPMAIGCASCHLGNTFTMDKAQAHEGMVLVPGNLAQAKRTCGTSRCHPLLARRVIDTLMATGRGMVAVDRFVFGEADSPNAWGDLSKLGSSPADDHLRKLCASCHLGKNKNNPMPIDSLSRGGGCTACHLKYSPEAKEGLKTYTHKGKLPDVHPALTIKVTREHCFGCHSRSGRISTNYEGWHETLMRPEEVRDNPAYRILKDGRGFVHMGADVHFERAMGCVDCHTWREAMGDGKIHLHEEDQVEISCEDCHPLETPKTISADRLKEIDAKIPELRKPLNGLDRFVLTKKTGKALINVTLDRNGAVVVIGKNSGKLYRPKRPRSVCSKGIYGHDRLTCQTCHTPWAPACIKCHTSYDRSGMGLDHNTGKRVKGRWVEERADLLARQPALGIRAIKSEEKVDTFIPGMILTIDLHAHPNKGTGQPTPIFRRLYAPTAAHTTSAKGLECGACHINTVAIGVGEGLFSLKRGRPGKVKITFRPLFPLRPEDGLSNDAWIGFLKDRCGMVSTRIGARPFSPTEQIRIIRVGVCLSCHPASKKNIRRIYADFLAALKRIGPQCLVLRTQASLIYCP